MPKVYYLRAGEIVDEFEVLSGSTIRQAMEQMYPEDKNFPAPTLCFLGSGAVRMRNTWDAPLGCSDDVTFCELVQGGGGGGGGSNAMTTIMQFAVILAAAAATWYVGGSGAILGVTALGLGSAAGAAAGLAVYVGGMLLMGQLAGQQGKIPSALSGSLDAAQASPTYNINSSGNQARLWQIEPEGFGRMKIVNDRVAVPWMQYVDNYQYGYYVLGIGRGLYNVESLSFGDTVFWRNGQLVADTGYEVSDIEFIEPGNRVTVFPDNVETSEEVSGQVLLAPNDSEYEGWIGPYAACSPGSKVTRIVLDIVMPQGCGYMDDKGSVVSYSVSWEFQYQAIDDDNNPTSGWAVLHSSGMSKGDRTAQRLTHLCDVAEGRFWVRGRRTSNTSGDGRALDTIQWTALRGMLPGTLTYPQSVVAFKVKGTNSLTQSASSKFSMVATRKLPLYDLSKKTWSEPVPTSSWAAAVCAVARASWGGRMVDAQIDLDAIWSIDKRLKDKGWFYNAYLDGPYNVWELIGEMCKAVCVIPRLTGTILSFIEDGPNRPVRFVLTPRHIMRGTFKVTFGTWDEDTPDDVQIAYKDADAGFQDRDVRAVLPESESTYPYELTLLGPTNREQAFRIALAMSARNRWRRIIVECQVEAIGRLMNLGDVVSLAHPRFRETCSGVIDGWHEQSLTLMLHSDMASGLPSQDDGPVYLSLTRPDGSPWGPVLVDELAKDYVTLSRADYMQVLAQGMDNPFDWINSGVDRVPTVWALHASRMFDRQMIVMGVVPQDLWHYTVVMCNNAPEVHQYGGLPTPLWHGRVALPSSETVEAPFGLSARVIDQAGPSLEVTWGASAGAQWYEIQARSLSGTNPWTDFGRFVVSGAVITVPPGPLEVRVRAAREDHQSSWAIWKGNTNARPPATPVVAAQGAYTGGSVMLAWAAVPEATSYLIGVYRNQGGQSGATIISAETTALSWKLTPEMQGDGDGPFRDIRISVSAKSSIGTSEAMTIDFSDPLPLAPAGASIISEETSLVLNELVMPSTVDVTGYVILRGDSPTFGIDAVQEMRVAQRIPYTWSGLQAGTTYYFRIAPKDAFYDLTGQTGVLGLNYSAVLTAKTTGQS